MEVHVETFIAILLVVIVILQIVQMTQNSAFKSESYRRWNTLEAIFSSATNLFTAVAESVKQIAESKRLSTVLTIETKKNLDIKPEDFEPKKEELRLNMLTALEEKLKVYTSKTGRITEPDTLAFVIFNRSGFDKFVDDDVLRNARKALARLLANQDLPSTKRFITTLARNL